MKSARLSVAIAVGLLLARAAFAAQPPAVVPGDQAGARFEPFAFILAGDTELGSPDFKGTAERFLLLARRANTLAAAFVIVPGDLTHDNTPEEFKAFDDAVKQCSMPVKVIPGNHDDPTAYRTHFGADHYVFTHSNCDFVCLNSNLSGSSAKAQWAWFEEALQQARQQKRTHVFVVMHHPEADRAPMAALLVKYGVKAVLCGHLHRTEEIRGNGFVTYVSPGTAKFRDGKGLGYRVFKVYADRFEQEPVPLEREVTKVKLDAPTPAANQ